jgi:AcrR family transcriptional regulator
MIDSKNNETPQDKPSKAELTRRRIMQAGLGLLQEKDFHQATMREIAKRAGVALGATYYYFKSKDDIVMEFYKEIQKESALECERSCREIPDFEGRVRAVLNAKFAQFQSSRKLLGTLFRSAGDPKHPLSPFSPETRPIREEAIGLFSRCLEGTSVKVAEDFRPYLPRLLWFYQMGLILFWIHDNSSSQNRTRFLMDKSLKLLMQLLNLSRFPFLGSLRRSVVSLIKLAFEESEGIAKLSGQEGLPGEVIPTPQEITEVEKILSEDEIPPRENQKEIPKK